MNAIENETKYSITESTLLTELMAITIDELKAQQDVWQKLSEVEQDDVIKRLQARCTDATKQVVNLITSSGFSYLPATLDSLTFKDGIKAVLTFSGTDPQRHALSDLTGGKVTVVLANVNSFMSPHHEHKAQPQQADMLSAEVLKKIVNSEVAKPKKKTRTGIRKFNSLRGCGVV